MHGHIYLSEPYATTEYEISFSNKSYAPIILFLITEWNNLKKDNIMSIFFNHLTFLQARRQTNIYIHVHTLYKFFIIYVSSDSWFKPLIENYIYTYLVWNPPYFRDKI